MKSMIMTFGSAALLLASVYAIPTTNFPRQDSSCLIRMKNRDGDASVGINIPANKLFSTANTPQARAGVNADAVTPGCVCQAFSDAAGTKKIGGIFTDSTEASFTDASDGSVDLKADQAVPIGSFCCVTAPNAVPNCSNTPPPPPPPTKNVRVQLSLADDSAMQVKVPADGSAFALSFSSVNAVEIVQLEGAKKATCQAFSDKNATKAVSRPFRTDLIFLCGGRDVKVLSLRCKSA